MNLGNIKALATFMRFGSTTKLLVRQSITESHRATPQEAENNEEPRS